MGAVVSFYGKVYGKPAYALVNRISDAMNSVQDFDNALQLNDIGSALNIDSADDSIFSFSYEGSYYGEVEIQEMMAKFTSDGKSVIQVGIDDDDGYDVMLFYNGEEYAANDLPKNIDIRAIKSITGMPMKTLLEDLE